MVSISRKKSSVVRPATTRGASPQAAPAGAAKTVAELVGDEKANTQAWFDRYRDLLRGQINTIVAVLDLASPDDKDGLRLRKAECEDQLASLAQQQEAFFNQGTLALNPPGPEVIRRTQELATQMDGLIRSQKRAEAIAALVGELANLVQKVGVDA